MSQFKDFNNILVVRLRILSLSSNGKAINSGVESIRSPLKPINGQTTSCIPRKVEANDCHMPVKIIDLHFDYLERILQLLCLQDLINVASTCQYLKNNARDVFSSLYGDYNVMIDLDDFPRFTVIDGARQSFGANVTDFLKIFGNLLTSLKIRNMKDSINDRTIAYFLMANCDELKSICFQNCHEQSMNKVKPFKKVTEVTFDHCVLGEWISDFEVLFPCMAKLELIDCDASLVRKSIEKRFPHLLCLKLDQPLDVNTYSMSSFNLANVMAAIDQNPQIQSLTLCYWNFAAYDAQLLKYAANHLPKLESLELKHLRYTDFRSHGDLQFDDVRTFTLNNFYHSEGLLAKNLSKFSFPALKTFQIKGQFNNECVSFLSRHQSINKMVCLSFDNHDFYPTDNDMIQIATVLPNLRKIVVNAKRLTANGLIRVIMICPKLMEIRFRYYTVIRREFELKCSELGWRAVCQNMNGVNEIVVK